MGMDRTIRTASESDIPGIMTVISAAREMMRRSGNPFQWPEGYPSREMIGRDIASGAGRVLEDDGVIVGYFAFIPSPEPAYSVIDEGEWLDDSLPYHVIHRMASVPDVHGVFRSIMDWCLARERNIRIDTHRDNRVMQHCLRRAGFTYCGIIHLANGEERLAYQHIVML